MKLGIMVLLLMLIPSLAQEKPQQPSNSGNAKTTGPCSPAIPGNNNRVIYNGDCLSASQLEEDQKLNTRAYEGLGEALANTAKAQGEWEAAISVCEYPLLRHRAFNMNKSPIELQVAQEQYHFCMLDSEKTFDPKWKADRGPITKAIDDAMARIEANEEKNLPTPNKRNAWKNDFNQTWGAGYSSAIAKADDSPSLAELISNDSNKDRFAPLTKFLRDLRNKLGDYPSQ